ncbi:MAG: helix-turn-helix domain-containing protein [Chloroflexota bacterium]
MPTMGEVLREARYRLRVSLEEVEEYTKIRKKYLIALEGDDYSELPAPVYARGFLQSYAEYLGIDPIFADKLFQPPQEVQVAPPIRPAASGIPASAGISLRGLITVFLALLGVAAIVFLYWQYAAFVSPGNLMDSVTNPAPAVTATSVRVAAAAPSPTPTALPTPSPTPVRAVEVTVNITDRSWMRVIADGGSSPVFEGELQPGDARTWKAKDRIDMRVGNAGGVEVTVNGMRQGKLGASGEVKNVTWGRQ